jgi:uncharacterized protein (TIGR01244 family)
MKWQHPVLPGACQPIEGVVACGLPGEQELREAHEGGLRTVINLCPVAEQKIDEQALITGLGMRYVHLPIAGPADLTRANAMKLAELLADPTVRPLMIHCASGNRVGALFALKAFFADGADRDTALAAGRAAGLKALEGAVSAIIQREAVHASAGVTAAAPAACSATTIDRVVFRFAGSFVLASLVLAQLHSPNWLWFTAFVGANMLQASFTGFCPLARILAWFGVPYGAAFGRNRATS